MFIESEPKTWDTSDYDRLLAESESLFQAKWGTPEGRRLDNLATLLVQYEDLHENWPSGSLDPAALAEFRRDNGYTVNGQDVFPSPTAPKAKI